MASQVLAGVALAQVPDLLKHLISAWQDNKDKKGKGLKFGTGFEKMEYGGKKYNKDGSLRKKRKPSAYNLFMKQYLSSHNTKGLPKTERENIFRAGVAAWRAKGHGFVYPTGGTQFGASRPLYYKNGQRYHKKLNKYQIWMHNHLPNMIDRSQSDIRQLFSTAAHEYTKTHPKGKGFIYPSGGTMFGAKRRKRRR